MFCCVIGTLSTDINLGMTIYVKGDKYRQGSDIAMYNHLDFADILDLVTIFVIGNELHNKLI